MIEDYSELAVFIPQILELAFYCMTLFFLVYSTVLGFHWFSYSTSKTTSTLALVVYLGGSAFCFLLMSVALIMM